MSGVLLALLSAVFATSKDLVSKQIAYSVHGTISTLASFLFALPFYVVLLAALYFFGVEDFSITSDFLLYILLRSITDTFAELFKMHALKEGEMSYIAVFLSLSPLILLITSPLITGDKPSVLGIVAIVIITLGILLLMYHPEERKAGLPWKGIFLALLSSVFFSLNTCFDRLAVTQASAALSGFSMTLLAALFLLPLSARVPGGVAQLVQGQRMFWSRGLLETLFMVTKLIALQFLQAPYVAGIQKLGLVFSIIGGKVFFDDKFFRRRFLTSLLIIGGVLLIVLSEIRI